MADFHRGVFYGRVRDLATGKPVADAIVAIEDKSGRVVAWTRTNAEGQYAVAADPLKTLCLPPSRNRSLLAKVARGVGQVAMAPVEVAGAAFKVVKDTVSMKTVESVAMAAATGDPGPVIVQIAGSTRGTVDGVNGQAQTSAKVATVKTVFGEPVGAPAHRETFPPGTLRVLVSATGYQKVSDRASAYWLDPPTVWGTEPVGPQAWLDTVDLALASDGKKKSAIASEAVLLTDPTLEPAVVPAGASIKLSVKLKCPVELAPEVRVFAREARTHTVVELLAQPGKDACLFSGELALPANTPPGDTVVTLVGLHSAPIEVGLATARTDPLKEFARRVDDLDPRKRYEYDPRIMATANRCDLPLTVLNPDLATPTLIPSKSPLLNRR